MEGVGYGYGYGNGYGSGYGSGYGDESSPVEAVESAVVESEDGDVGQFR